MNIIEKCVTPNGIEIQLEQWEDGLTIGAYPIAKNTGKYRWVESGRKFRLTIANNKYMNYTDEDVKADYEALKNGTKTLQDLSEHFWYRKKDMFYLGMIENEY